MKKRILIPSLILALVCYLLVSFTTNTSLFDDADIVMSKYKCSNKRYMIIIDYTKPITKDRLYLLDVKNKTVVLKCRVGHAIKSGILTPMLISNEKGSDKTCDGVFVTKGTYFGSFGYSMVVKGLDKGVNDNCEVRKIIFHSNEKSKFDLWSKGCFVTTKENNEKIINLTKNGCLVYVKS